MLASDLNNPEFSNPVNPDSLLHVEFFWRDAVDKWQSEAQGKEVRKPKVAFVRLMRPGDPTSIIETAVRPDHKARWPQKWLAWQVKEGLLEGANQDVPGWKIEDWPVVKGEQVNELRYLRFTTVEQIAGASDAQIQRLGLGGIGLREQAKAAIKERHRAEYASELAQRDKENAELRDRLAKLESMMADSMKPKQEAKQEAKQDTLHVPKKA